MARIEKPESPLVDKLSGLHLFHFEGAPCAQRVRFAMYEKGLMRAQDVHFEDQSESSLVAREGTWVSRQVSLIKSEHMTPAYAAINPNLVVPALVHDGDLHIDSMDIVEYLDNTFGGTPLMPRDNPELLGETNALIALGKELHRSLRFVVYRWSLRGIARLSEKQESNLKQLLHGKPDKENLVEFYEGFDSESIPQQVYDGHLQKLTTAYAELDKRLADGRAFLTSDDLSMADALWAMKTMRLYECDYPFAKCFPHVYQWFLRMRQRPSFREEVVGTNKFMSRLFRSKAKIENLIGIGLKREVLNRVA